MKKSDTPLLKHISGFLDYCDIVKGLSSRTQENYKKFLNKFANWLKQEKLENLLPHELTDDVIYKYRLYLSRNTGRDKKGLKKSTQNYYLIALRALLSYFVVKDILSLPPEKITLAKEAKVKKVKFLTLEQLEKLLNMPLGNSLQSLRDRAILETLFSTGLRVGELAALNREQINVDYIKKHNFETIELPVTGKGGYTRTVYFSPRALKSLVAYLEKRTDMDKALFINLKKDKTKDSKRLTIRSIERLLKRYVKLTGLPLDTTPHTLRHSYATDLLNQGVDLRVIQEFLGHQNIVTTQIYTHLTNKRLKDIHKKFHSGERLK